MEKRKLNDEYKEIAERLIDTLPELAYIKDSAVRIAYLDSDFERKSRGKAVLAECEKVQAKNQWAIDYDFTITVFEKNTYGMSDKQIEILLEHELYHVGIDLGETEEYYLVPHDLEDFRTIIDKYGTDWDAVQKVQEDEPLDV